MATYSSLAELKVFLRITDSSDDTLLTLALEAATRQIDLTCGTDSATATASPAVELATLLQAARWYKRQDSPYGVLGSQEFGNYTRLLAQLDPDVQLLLDGFGERARWGTQ